MQAFNFLVLAYPGAYTSVKSVVAKMEAWLEEQTSTLDHQQLQHQHAFCAPSATAPEAAPSAAFVPAAPRALAAQRAAQARSALAAAE